MNTRRQSAPKPASLRARAEQLLSTTGRQVAQMPADDVQKLVHELQVHQIELEMQNDELRRKQLELEQARDRYSDLFDFSPSAYLTLSLRGEILEANLHAGELLGLEPGRLLHQKFTHFVPAEAQDAFYLFFRQVFSSETRQSVDLELVTAQSNRLFVQVEAVSDTSSSRRQCRFTFNDLSERKRMEQSLRESQQFAKSVVDSLAASIAIVDHRGRIVSVNEHWREFATENGAALEAVCEGADYLAVCLAGAQADADVAAITDGLRDTLTGRIREFQHEYACHSPTEERWFSMRVTPFSKDSLRRVVVAHEDITERKRTEVALLNASQFNQQIISGAKEGIVVYGRDLKYQVWNPFMEELTGLRAAEVIGKHPREVFPFLQASGVLNELNRVLAGHECTAKEFKFQMPATGRSGWVSDTSAPLRNTGGEIIGVIGVVSDISERKRAEARIAQLNRVEAVVAGIDRAIVRISDQKKLLAEVCRVAVEAGLFKLAWIGMVAPDSTVAPVAKAGATGYLKGAWIVAQDVPEGRGAVGTAIREQRPVVVEDISQDPRMGPWQDRARKFGLNYMAAFPLRVAGRVAGSFQVYSPQAGFFDEAEIRLLTLVSEEISYALTAIAEFTARQRAEAALRASEARLQAILDHSPARIFLKDIQGRYLILNRAVAEASHLSLTESLGKTDSELFPSGTSANLRTHDREILAAGVPKDFEEQVVQDDGTHTFIVTKFPLRDACGKIYAIGGIATDITARKQAEEALRLSEHNLANFFEQAPIGLVWLSASGLILRANRAQLDQTGYSAEEYLGQSFIKFCAEPAQGIELLKRLATRATLSNFPMTRRCKDGTIRHVLLSATSFWSNKQFQYSSIFLRDITDRIELEKEILQVGERERQRMAQDLHDGLGQLLVGAAYLASILRQDLTRQSRPEARRLGRVLEVINEAIALTRNLARGLHPVQAEPNGLMVALAALADRTKKLFHVSCRFLCRRPVLIQDNAVATHLFRIAQEAITNAIKHGKPGRIVISLTETPGQIALAIQDNGVGLPVRLRKNNGMGLRIMRYRAGMIGGSLTVQKGSGGGTTIVCTVPLPAAAGINRRPPVSRKQPNQKD